MRGQTIIPHSLKSALLAAGIATTTPAAVADETVLYDDILLQTGQVIVTESGGPVSALMALIPEEFHPYSHTGIIAVEEGKAVVYEARGDYKMGPGTPASSWFRDRSGIRRLPIEEYLAREKYARVFAPPSGVDTVATVAFARRHHDVGTPFDPYFDDRTTDALYCAELVHAALVAGGGRGATPVPLRDNPSLETVLRWWGIRDRSILPVGLLVAGLRPVGELGDPVYREEALVFNAFKAELHRRFTPDQKLGNIFRFNGDLEFREAIVQLLKRARHGAEPSASFDQERLRVRKLADDLFGPVER